MKKIQLLLSSIILIGFAVFSHAQLGFRVGTTLSNQDIEIFSERIDTRWKPGFGAGAFYQIKVNEYLSIQSELNFIQMGHITSRFEFGQEYKNYVTFNYWQMPLGVKYQFDETKIYNLNIQAGAYVARAPDKIRIKNCISGDCTKEKQSYGNGESNPVPFDYGCYFGTGINITKNISLDFRYNLGLHELLYNSFFWYRNDSFFFSLAYTKNGNEKQ